MEEIQEVKKGKSVFSWIVIILFIILILTCITGATSYKKEVLSCNFSDDICTVEKTNLFNIKTTKKIAKYSDIESAGYMRNKVKGNRYAKGYTSYILKFDLKNNQYKEIFSNIYFDHTEINKDIAVLNKNIEAKKDFVIKRIIAK